MGMRRKGEHEEQGAIVVTQAVLPGTCLPGTDIREMKDDENSLAADTSIGVVLPRALTKAEQPARTVTPRVPSPITTTGYGMCHRNVRPYPQSDKPRPETWPVSYSIQYTTQKGGHDVYTV